MDISRFLSLLAEICEELTVEAKVSAFQSSQAFESAVREKAISKFSSYGFDVDHNPHAQAFPDVCIGEFGIEVKHTFQDTWRCIANSISQKMRDKTVEHIYVVYGKMGGDAEVRFKRYEDAVMHVRTSHVPRFEVDMNADSSLFNRFGLAYADFSALPMSEKMVYVRDYARSRLKKGERLWWLDYQDEPEHTLPIQVRFYMNLSQAEKRRLRAEGVVLCPSVVQGSRSRGKYNDVVMYFLTYHGVLCPQARDLFTAGSVALKADQSRGGNYMLRALQDLSEEIELALLEVDGKLLEEYWGRDVAPENRKEVWLNMLDANAKGWKPSEELGF